MDLAIDREPGLVQDYLGGMRDRQPAAWRLLPADTLMAMDSVMDAPRLLRLLRAHARNTLGTSGETVFLGMELAAQARLGLSFSDQLLPLVGVEWGLAVVPGAPGDSPQLVGFCVPEDPALLAVVLERVAPRLPLGVTPPAPGGEPFYILNMNPQAEKPSLTYLLQTGPTVFVSDNPEALRQILAASRSGATFNPSVLQDPPAGVRRIQMLYGRTDLPGLFGRGAPASGVPFLGQTCLSDSGLSADFLMPRSALAGLVQLLPGLLARVPLSPAAEADAAPSPDAADPRP